MRKLKRRKAAAEQTGGAPQVGPTIADESGSDGDMPEESVDPSKAYDALLSGLRYHDDNGHSVNRQKLLRHKPSAAASLPGAALEALPSEMKAQQQVAAHHGNGLGKGDQTGQDTPSSAGIPASRKPDNGPTPTKAQSAEHSREWHADHAAQQFDRLLSDPEAAELRSSPREFRETEDPELPAAWKGASCLITGPGLVQAPACLEAAGVQPRLITRWREVHGGSNSADAESDDGGAFVSDEQRAFFGFCVSWKDILYTQRPYPTRAHGSDAIMDAYLLHAIHHISVSAARIKKNNDALKAERDAATPRDQGFTRAKVLLLLPMRSTALRVVSRLCELAQKETRADSIQNKGRFLEEFGDQESEEGGEPGQEGEEGGEPGQGSSKKAGSAQAGKPAEHAVLFGGNCDDHFRLGIKVTRGAVKLYSDFLQSDIIVASPIALATKLSDEVEEGGPADFLSSIEIAIVDRADVQLMQNWAHVVTVFQALNRLPEAQHGTDIMRVREPLLAGQGAQHRQTIMLSSFASAEMNALMNRSCCNWAGQVKLRLTHQGVLGQALPQLRQLFERLPAASAAADADTRFVHFCSHVWPQIKEASAKGQLIFVASYYDYVRLRNFLKEQEVQVAALSEYAPPKEAARARSLFLDGRLHVALLTERSHFYNRARVRGTQDLLFYQLPQHAHFYLELVNMLAGRDQSGLHATVRVLFTRMDALRLEPIVGSVRSQKMLKGSKSTFLFC